MFKIGKSLVFYSWDEKTPLPEGMQVGAYLWHDGRWEWTRDLDERPPDV